MVLMEINDTKTDFSFSAQCNGNGITALIKDLIWKDKALIFLQLLFYDVTNKGYHPFGSIFAQYSLNWISNGDCIFFQSISKRLYILGVLQRLTTAMFDPH